MSLSANAKERVQHGYGGLYRTIIIHWPQSLRNNVCLGLLTLYKGTLLGITSSSPRRWSAIRRCPPPVVERPASRPWRKPHSPRRAGVALGVYLLRVRRAVGTAVHLARPSVGARARRVARSGGLHAETLNGVRARRAFCGINTKILWIWRNKEPLAERARRRVIACGPRLPGRPSTSSGLIPSSPAPRRRSPAGTLSLETAPCLLLCHPSCPRACTGCT